MSIVKRKPHLIIKIKKENTLSETILSPTLKVGYIDSEGILFGSAIEERKASVMAIAANTLMTSSEQILSQSGNKPFFASSLLSSAPPLPDSRKHLTFVPFSSSGKLMHRFILLFGDLGFWTMSFWAKVDVFKDGTRCGLDEDEKWAVLEDGGLAEETPCDRLGLGFW